MSRSYWFFVLVLVIRLFGTPQMLTAGEFSVEKIPLAQFYYDSPEQFHWRWLPVISGEAVVQALDSARPPIPCTQVRFAGVQAQWLLAQIDENRLKLSGWSQWLNNSCPQRAAEALYWVRYIMRQIKAQQGELAKYTPPEFQVPDRTRRITWPLSTYHFADVWPNFIGRETFNVISAKMEVIDGGWIGKFKEPDGVAISLPGVNNQGESEAEKELARNILQWVERGLLKSTAHVSGHWDWEGSKHVVESSEKATKTALPNSMGGGLSIVLEETLTPAQACVPNFALTGALMLKARFYDLGTRQQSIRYGTGPVVLQYQE